MSCHVSSSSVANRVASEVKTQLGTLKGELKRDFTQITGKQQAQLDRIEGQLAELLALLKPDALSKPSLLKRSVDTQP